MVSNSIGSKRYTKLNYRIEVETASKMNNQLNSIGNMATRNLSTRNQETLENDMDLASNESTDHNGTNCRAGVFVVCSVVALVLI